MGFVYFKKLHPSAKINFFPRLLAAYSCVLFLGAIRGAEIWTFPLIIIAVGGLVWPYLALLLAALTGTKRQEIINMYVDVMLTCCIFLIAPHQMVLFSVVIILFTNATFTGSYRLLFTTALLTTFMVVGGFSLFELKWITITQNVIFLIMGFLIIYFIFFAFMVFHLIQNFIQLNKKFKKLSIEDPLTGSFNRLHLDKELQIELHRSFRISYPLTIIFADIDHFKNVNDEHGHCAGDQILKSFVEIANSIIRANIDWIARFGGDEFIIVLPNSNSKKGLTLAERIRHNIEKEVFEINDQKFSITCSFGVASLESFEQPVEAAQILTSADNALYSAKDDGRNCVKKVTVV
jgi:diguanylate cyclase